MIIRKLFLAASVALAALSTHAEPVEVHDFDIFVDPPTAFVFVKLPLEWKFVGKIDAKRSPTCRRRFIPRCFRRKASESRTPTAARSIK